MRVAPGPTGVAFHERSVSSHTSGPISLASSIGAEPLLRIETLSGARAESSPFSGAKAA